MNIFKRYFASFLGLLISFIALFWLSTQFNFSELLKTFKTINLHVLLIIPFLIALSFCLRAERWRILVLHSPPVRYWPSFSALMIGYLLNNLLPARAGDIARAIELGKTEKISRTKVFATLLTERAVDLLATLILLAFVMLSYPKLPLWLKESGIVVSIISITACSVLALFHTKGRKWIPLMIKKFGHYLPANLDHKISVMLISALEGVETIFNKRRATSFLLLTALIWMAEVFIVYLVAASINFPLAIGNALFVLLILAIGLMIPSSPGFVGTYEFFGISALGLIGAQGDHALSFIVLLHVVSLIGSTILGVICLLLRHSKSHQ